MEWMKYKKKGVSYQTRLHSLNATTDHGWKSRFLRKTNQQPLQVHS